jgi:hypothetical protein
LAAPREFSHHQASYWPHIENIPTIWHSIEFAIVVVSLQARKKGSSKLCFFNYNFGIFEQWETEDEALGLGNGYVLSIFFLTLDT